MPQNTKPQLTTLAGICRRLTEARKRVADLEAQRDALITSLRTKGVSGSVLASRSGLSAGRVTQISQSKDGHKPS